VIKVVNALLAILSGVLGALLLYYVLNKVVEKLPNKWEDRVKPYVFVGPAVVVIGFFLCDGVSGLIGGRRPHWAA